MNKRALLCLFCCFILFCSACGKNSQEAEQTALPENVELLVWGAEEDKELLQQIFISFQAEYQGQANFYITYAPKSESACKDSLLEDLEQGADVFTFADDQLNALAAAGALEPLADPQSIKEANLSSAVEAASVGDVLYAYPLTADNGYFLYYNKRYLTDEDVRTMDSLLDVAARNGKKMTMDWSSAWYVYAFFGNTGLEVGLNKDGITNFCTWNQTGGSISGVDVAQAMLRIAASNGFANRTDVQFLEGARNGSVIAGVSGVWNAVALEEAWGDYLGAAKLPTFTCAGQQIQMASFSGCKLVGVNAYSEHKEWANKLAEWIANEKNQRLRFEMRGQGPANIQAAASAEVQSSPAIAALLAQSEFSQLQRVGGKFWYPVSLFAQNMAAHNRTGEDLQKQLDKMVENITALT